MLTTVALTIATTFVHPFQENSILTLVKIDRLSTFTGKLGRRNSEIWEVESGHKHFIIKIQPYNTNVVGTKVYKVGDQVKITSSIKSGQKIDLKSVHLEN
jgi:hypothetical protein